MQWQWSCCKNKSKKILAIKMWLRVWEYSQGEYLYQLSNQGLTIKYKIYSPYEKTSQKSIAIRKDISK